MSFKIVYYKKTLYHYIYFHKKGGKRKKDTSKLPKFSPSRNLKNEYYFFHIYFLIYMKEKINL